MPGYSLTWQSAIVFIIVWLLKTAGIGVEEGNVTTMVLTLVQVITAVGILYGRWRKKDINIFGKRV